MLFFSLKGDTILYYFVRNFDRSAIKKDVTEKSCRELVVSVVTFLPCQASESSQNDSTVIEKNI